MREKEYLEKEIYIPRPSKSEGQLSCDKSGEGLEEKKRRTPGRIELLRITAPLDLKSKPISVPVLFS